MRNFHLLMCSLALYDLVSLILDIGCFAVGKFSVYYRDNILMFAIPYVIPLTQVSINKLSVCDSFLYSPWNLMEVLRHYQVFKINST